MPPPPLLRTGRASFNASGASISKAPLTEPGSGLLVTTLPSRYWPDADTPAGGKPRQQSYLALPSTALFPKVGWSDSLVIRHPREVCPLSRGIMFQPLSVPLPHRFRLLPLPLPTPPSLGLAAFLPLAGSDMGLPRSLGVPEWVRSRRYAGGAPSASADH